MEFLNQRLNDKIYEIIYIIIIDRNILDDDNYGVFVYYEYEFVL